MHFIFHLIFTDSLHPRKKKGKWHQKFKFLWKLYTISKESENSLQVWNSIHTSFYTVKLKHPAVWTRREYLTGGRTLIWTSLTVGASCTAIHRCPQWFGVVPRLYSPLASSGCLPERQLSGWQSGKTQRCKPEGWEKLHGLKEDKQCSSYAI